MSVHVAAPPELRRAKKKDKRGSAKAGKKKKPADDFAASKCGGCIALCCRYFALQVDTPTEPKDFEDLRWYLLHDKVQIFVEGREWYVQIFNKCQWLGEDNKCQGYEQRPTICREYENDHCDLDELQEPAEYDKLFRTLAELEAFRDTWVVKYEKRRKKKRKAAALKAAETRRRKQKKKQKGKRK
jgi:Fe-S-cluster containining protein